MSQSGPKKTLLGVCRKKKKQTYSHTCTNIKRVPESPTPLRHPPLSSAHIFGSWPNPTALLKHSQCSVQTKHPTDITTQNWMKYGMYDIWKDHIFVLYSVDIQHLQQQLKDHGTVNGRIPSHPQIGIIYWKPVITSLGICTILFWLGEVEDFLQHGLLPLALGVFGLKSG